MTPSEFVALDGIIQKLRSLRNEQGTQDHRADVYSLLAESIIPIELAYKDSLVLIARTDDSYSLKLL